MSIALDIDWNIAEGMTQPVLEIKEPLRLLFYGIRVSASPACLAAASLLQPLKHPCIY